MWKTRAVSLIAALSAGLASGMPVFAQQTANCICYYGTAQETACHPVSQAASSDATCRALCPEKDIQGLGLSFLSSAYFTNQATFTGAMTVCIEQTGELMGRRRDLEAREAARKLEFTKPILSFDIPGLSFTEPLVRGDKLEVAYLADYITAAYRMLLGISITIAIVMVMLGGIQYVLGAGTGEVKKAKERITNAVTGLVLMLGVYVILFTINPQLTLLPALQVDLVREIAVEREDDEVAGTLAIDFKAPSGSNLQGPGLAQVPAELTGNIEAVAKKMDEQGYGINVASSFRSVEKQKELIRENCQNPPGSATCNPKPGKPQTCILKNGPASCPHTTGRALDLWATKKNSEGVSVQCVSQKPTCINNMNACFNDPCQKALINAMKEQGFCVLGSEAWHFEKPKMSSNCH